MTLYALIKCLSVCLCCSWVAYTTTNTHNWNKFEARRCNNAFSSHVRYILFSLDNSYLGLNNQIFEKKKKSKKKAIYFLSHENLPLGFTGCLGNYSQMNIYFFLFRLCRGIFSCLSLNSDINMQKQNKYAQNLRNGYLYREGEISFRLATILEW